MRLLAPDVLAAFREWPMLRRRLRRRATATTRNTTRHAGATVGCWPGRLAGRLPGRLAGSLDQPPGLPGLTCLSGLVSGGMYLAGGSRTIALLSLGVAAAVRDSAVAIGLGLGLLYLFPIVASLVSNATIARYLDQIGPLSAGLDAQATIGVSTQSLTPWQGLGVVALWTAGTLLLGAIACQAPVMRAAWRPARRPKNDPSPSWVPEQ
jgi:ABC-2 type transport system permease protein